MRLTKTKAEISSTPNSEQVNQRVSITLTSHGKSPLSALRELFAARELVFFLVWRDLKVRYRQTVLGLAWILLQPLVSLILFTVIFGRLAKLPSDGLPYQVFVVSGLVIWTFFINGVLAASNSVIANEALVSKIYFPRLAIPLSAILSGLVDFLVSFAFMAVILLLFGVAPTLKMLLFIPLTFVAFLAACGAGFFLAGLNVLYRDVKHLVPFMAQVWFFGSPVVYPLSLFPKDLHLLLAINPMTGILEGCRWAVGASNAPWVAILCSVMVSVIMLVTGIVAFTRGERRFADVI